jgi:hypothetical protein
VHSSGLSGLVVAGELVVGPRPSAELLAELEAQGVSAVLCLLAEHEAPAPSTGLGSLRWARVPLADGHLGGALEPARLVEAVELLTRWRGEGYLTYLHCSYGVGRAPTIAAAYLMAVHGLPFADALATVRAARPQARPTAQQLQILAQYATWLRQQPPGHTSTR